MKLSELKTSRLLDIIFCVVFMPLLIFLGHAHYWMTEWPLFFILATGYMYGCYFAMKRINLPGLILAKRYRRICIIMMILAAGNYALSLYPHPSMDFVIPSLSEYQTTVRDYSISLTLWLMFITVTCYSITTSFIRELYDQLLLRKEIENQRDKAELAMFKAQISPHFLFNTLNSLYSLVIGTSQKAEDAFIKFTDILKYTYVTIENESVPLRDEIAYIHNYIDLQMIRLNSHTTVKCDFDVDNENILIPPMIFLTFVENAFKYGASTSRDCTVAISMSLKDGNLEFETRNRIMKHADTFRTEVPTGIENCRARLSGIYPERHRLITSEDNGTFRVNLSIKDI